jgi:cytochrome c oxidase cbb3-type subunit 3
MRKACFILVLAIAAFAVLPSCRQSRATPKRDPLLEAYDVEKDWNNPDHLIPLNYQQAQGKRIFYEKCVWCHADSTPSGPSNRMNVQPTPPLINDGKMFNPLSDEYLENVINLGGAAVGKSAIMPPWGRTLTQDDIKAVVAYIRAVAEPPYQRPARPGPRYSAR